MGVKGGRLALFDDLGEIEPGENLDRYLSSIPDEKYQRYVSEDPADMAPVQTSGPVEGFTVVDAEEL